MIDRETVIQVSKLLEVGWPVAHVARIHRMNRKTVELIGEGKHKFLQTQPRRIKSDRNAGPVISALFKGQVPEKCPDCGNMVYMPCRHCRHESRKETDVGFRERRMEALVSMAEETGMGGKPAYMPTPEDIAKETAKLREQWDDEEMYKRAGKRMPKAKLRTAKG